MPEDAAFNRLALSDGVPTALMPVMRAWARAQATAAANVSAPVGTAEMTMTQLRLMSILLSRGRLHGRKLGTALEVSPSAIVPVIDRLEERGWVRRVINPGDRRVTWIELTEDGDAAMARFWLPVAGCVAKAVADFTEAERGTLELLLTRIADHLERSRGDSGP